MIPARILAILPVVGLLSCVSGKPVVVEKTVQNHYQQWSTLPQNYQVSFQQLCYCLPDYVRPMRISVKQNNIVSVIFEDDQSVVPAEIVADLNTIDAIFQVIINAEARPAHQVDIEFDPQFHFPLKVNIDFDSRIADDELYWQLSNLILSD